MAGARPWGWRGWRPVALLALRPGARLRGRGQRPPAPQRAALHRPRPGRPVPLAARPPVRPNSLNVTGVANQCWAFARVRGSRREDAPQLLLTASDGLYRINGAVAEPIVESANRSFGTFVVTMSPRRSPSHLGRPGRRAGLAAVGQWPLGERGPRGRLSEQVRSLHQAADGTLWAGTQSSGLLLLRGADVASGAGPRPVDPVDRALTGRNRVCRKAASTVIAGGRQGLLRGHRQDRASSTRDQASSCPTRPSTWSSVTRTPGSSTSSRGPTDASTSHRAATPR